MHNKSNLLSTINSCLQQKSNTSVTLNKTELYAGLADAYTHYLLENKLDLFFDALETLSTQPNNYHFGEDSILDAFIIQIEKMTHPKPIKTPSALETPWWEVQRDHLLTLAFTYSPCYVYKSAIQTTRAKQLLALKALDTLFYAIKANPHPSILNTLQKEGIGFECVSIQELDRVLSLFPGLDKKHILFTPNFAPKVEYEYALNLNCHITIDNLYPLTHWPELFKNHEILLRIDPGAGAGHHKHVCTGGNESKFGIAQHDLGQVIALVKKHNIQVVGLHSHSGSGILTPELWQQTALMLGALSEQFPQVQFINLGGGLGIVEKPGQQPLDLATLDTSLLEVKTLYPQLKFWMEPGRFFVAESGVLLAKMTQGKEKEEVKFIGVETGMNSLIRPALYGSYHEIVNLSRLHEEKTELCHIVGPICESGDTLGYDRLMPLSKEGDVFLIANAGAYGHSMSSYYNLRAPAQEIIFEDNYEFKS